MRIHRTFAVLGLAAASLAAQAPPPAQPAAPREPGLYATIQTSMGNIVARLFETETPITVKNFVDLQLGRKSWRDPKTRQMVRRPLYNGVLFHRVFDRFMIQTGDPTGTGAGDIGFTIKDEFNPALKFDKPGRLGMANAGPGTGSSQFFITTVPTPHLNGQHTIFGEVVEGQDVANAIGKVPANTEGRPRKPVILKTITFERVGPAPATDVLKPAVPKKGAPGKKAAPGKKSAPAKKAAPAK